MHLAFFSQTGSEIANIAEFRGVWPDYIVTNKKTIEGIDTRILDTALDRLIMIPNNPTEEDYLTIFKHISQEHGYKCTEFITLHGYLRIIPSRLCKLNIYNLHPGLISEHDGILKGKDPQIRAFFLKHKEAGCTLHKVAPEVDSGEIVDEQKVSIEDCENPEDVVQKLKLLALDMWLKFFNNEYN